MLSEEQRKKIGDKRKELESQEALRRAEPGVLNSWLPIYDALTANGVSFNIEYLYCTADAEKRQDWLHSISRPPLARPAFDAAALIKQEEIHPVQHRVHSRYPTLSAGGFAPFLSFGMVESLPDLPLQVRKKLLAFMGESCRNVFLFYDDLPPVISMSIDNALAHLDLLAVMKESLCIVSTDYERMIYRSSDNEWSWGKHVPYGDLYPADRDRYYVYWTTSGSWALDEVLTIAAPAIGAEYRTGDIDAAENTLRESGADEFTYLLRGKEMWIEVLLERQEGYFGWHCYTLNRDLVPEWRAYFKELVKKVRDR